MAKKNQRAALRERRHRRVRRHVRGTPERPRLAVYRSNTGIYAQVIDDRTGHTLAAAASNETDFTADGGKISAAKKVGELVADRAKNAGIKAVVFDRGGNRYHGRVKALAEAAREAGLDF